MVAGAAERLQLRPGRVRAGHGHGGAAHPGAGGRAGGGQEHAAGDAGTGRDAGGGVGAGSGGMGERPHAVEAGPAAALHAVGLRVHPGGADCPGHAPDLQQPAGGVAVHTDQLRDRVFTLPGKHPGTGSGEPDGRGRVDQDAAGGVGRSQHPVCGRAFGRALLPPRPRLVAVGGAGDVRSYDPGYGGNQLDDHLPADAR